MPPKGYLHYSQASQDYAEDQRERVGLADGEVAVKSVRPAHERGDWAVYAFNIRKSEWEIQPELIGVSLEIALTSILRWKDQGQDVRMETIPA